MIIADGENTGTIPVAIIGDAAPELNESLVVTLVSVELVSDEGVDGGPVLGDITETTVVILENDDPRGLFTITASDGSAMVRVVEPGSLVLGITLTVERQQGTIGPVEVSWSVTGGTALPGQDFIGMYVHAHAPHCLCGDYLHGDCLHDDCLHGDCLRGDSLHGNCLS